MFLKRQTWERLLLFLIRFLVNAATVGVALLLNALIDAAEASISSGDARPLRGILVLSVLYAACLGVLFFCAHRYQAWYLRKRLAELRNGLAEGTLRAGIARYEAAGSAACLTAFGQSFETIQKSVLENRISILDSVISIVLAALVLLWMNPLIAVVSIAAMAVPGLLPKLFTGSLGRAQTGLLDATTAYNETVSDLLNGYEVLKTGHAEQEMLARFAARTEALERNRERLASRMAAVQGLTTFSSVAIQFLVMGLAGFFAVRGYITLGSIVAVTQLTGQVLSPAFELSAKRSELKAAQPVLDTLDALSHPAPPEEQAVRPLRESLALRDVSFRYGERSVLNGVSAVFRRGGKYAILGKSGSGKSTLLKLLAGYCPGFTGEIRTDGSAALPDSVALLQQRPFLFRDTVRNNLTLWKPYPEEAIREAVEQAGLTEFVAALPLGLDTMVEANGANFSGGECQRIAIARALLSGKDLLLLDEATSALDEKTAGAVENSILSLQNVTCISVTHRLTDETARRYDAVLTLDGEGKLTAAQT